ncbi:hypothetical protein MKW92_031870 [Papaver armeniacum]|nr:hypothetical protein MKW92_031870 [Papaver armeniacum]
MVYIRNARVGDIPKIKSCDLLCFPNEDAATYSSFFTDSILSWPQLFYVAIYGGRIVGYVVAKMLVEEQYEDLVKQQERVKEDNEEEEKDDDEEAEEDVEECEGYISCLGVHPSHRKLGIARKLMNVVENAMVKQYGSKYVSLHVRVSNHAAIKFYTEKLGYKIHDSTTKFIDDGEDGYHMKKHLEGKQQPDILLRGFSHGGGYHLSEANAQLLGLVDRLEIC